MSNSNKSERFIIFKNLLAICVLFIVFMLAYMFYASNQNKQPTKTCTIQLPYSRFDIFNTNEFEPLLTKRIFQLLGNAAATSEVLEEGTHNAEIISYIKNNDLSKILKPQYKVKDNQRIVVAYTVLLPNDGEIDIEIVTAFAKIIASQAMFIFSDAEIQLARLSIEKLAKQAEKNLSEASLSMTTGNSDVINIGENFCKDAPPKLRDLCMETTFKLYTNAVWDYNSRRETARVLGLYLQEKQLLFNAIARIQARMEMEYTPAQLKTTFQDIDNLKAKFKSPCGHGVLARLNYKFMDINESMPLTADKHIEMVPVESLFSFHRLLSASQAALICSVFIVLFVAWIRSIRRLRLGTLPSRPGDSARE